MSDSTITIPTLDELLEKSAVTEKFATDLRAFENDSTPNDSIQYAPGCPPVKVLRTIMKLLEAFPEDKIQSVQIQGKSGCADFRGMLVVEGSTNRQIDFVWDCSWKAREAGWKTFWGDPDQARAAREYGYQCFQVFKET